MSKTDFRPYLVRLLITAVISILIVAAISEGAYLLQKEKSDRPPQTVQLIIPAGTSDRVASGEAEPSIPEKMIFVMGDVLEVRNDDSTSHQLGPVWVPPGATGRLELADPNKYSYSCSFAPSKVLGLDVRQPTTLSTRLTALGVAVPPTMAFLFIYGVLVFPIKPGKTPTAGSRG